MIVNINSNEAIMFLEAKKPLVVENKPTSARARLGKPINGVIKTLSSEPSQRNTGVIPMLIFLKKWLNSNPLLERSSERIPG